MAARDELNDPLGCGDAPGGSRPRWHLPYRGLAFAAGSFLVLAIVVFLTRYDDPLGGEPHAVATIAAPPRTQETTHASKGARRRFDQATIGDQGAETIAVPASDDIAADLERRSGVKVVRSGGARPPGALIIDVPEALAHKLAPAPDTRLVEQSRYGLLPRVGQDGTRPADFYARPSGPAAQPNVPRIAFIIGGLGLNDALTAAAIRDLPGVVTLGFAPYGKDLNSEVSKARNLGHEVILQLPMEPLDYPQMNPGPHTLLATASSAENAENLHWLLSRFTGYVGVENFLGGKLTTSPEPFRAILREIAARGLFYVDDGSSSRSTALELAHEIGLPVVRVDFVLDANGDPHAFDSNLAALETLARSRGLAIGMASDLPTSLEKVASFTKMAEARGILLIPLSAAIRDAGTQPAPARDARVFREP